MKRTGHMPKQRSAIRVVRRRCRMKLQRWLLPSGRFLDRIMASTDKWVKRHPWAKGGWVPSDRVTADYLSVFGKEEVERTMVESPHPIQQVRSEIRELLEAIIRHGRTRKIVEVGMGIVGGSHRLWSRVFDKVITVELLPDTVSRYILEEAPDKAQSVFIVGDSRSPFVIRRAFQEGDQCDVLFIDGDHTYVGVEADYLNYEGLVRSGGLIVFHDTQVDGPPSIQVRSFVEDLESGRYTGSPISFVHIRHSRCVGISYFQKE